MDICAFCGDKKPNKIIYSSIDNNIGICSNCLTQSNKLLFKLEEKENNNNDDINILKPIEIKKFLDDYIVGQDKAKKSISVATYNHYKRINFNQNNNEIQKSNILLLGPTGCGKTLIAKTIAKLLNVPFVIADSTSLTEAGYIGEDVENILLKLIQNANYDISLAEKGIIFIDEIDKISSRFSNSHNIHDVGGKGVQQSLLKIIEGSDIYINMHNNIKQENIKINTSNILFICSGAFDGIDKIVKQRINSKSIGFNIENKQDNMNYLNCVNSQDIIKYGLIPEFVGRLPIITCIQPLDENDMVNILSKPKNCLISQYKKLFEIDGVKLNFTNNALKLIAKTAINKKLGARGLRSILEKVMEDTMFEVPSKNIKTLNIDEKFINKKLN